MNFFIYFNNSCMNCHCLGCSAVTSLSSLFPFTSAMHFCCTFLFVCPFTCSAPVFTSLPRVSAGTHNHMHAQNAHCSGFGCFFCSGCWRLRVAAASFSGHEGKEERGSAHRESLFPAGVMRAVGCDCCGGLHPFGVRFSAVVPCVCACHLLCACVLGMFFRSVGRPPSFYGGLRE
ncbi:hypothetical protein Tc00.1047053511587.75 [Trypanosoma cruzi]|uniref:Uncharacterized protein n=1 Tax=Trypanosoma cruzi (strain CL Brener) TaxID=353153 RepID=Q4DFH2_TRYCC|nr:hypothetical protein Tc00.1047053511587.75 [Trypanosoma cruzi]EAN91276.1 hypothetical protein Tc00.1047053511587.75 [Trypanosoma cruzi]|eukprot:XP_813127.1 hypothetical protein [Trypanosoma cruzi strain CL Brener]